jgi:hypothetical protein
MALDTLISSSAYTRVTAHSCTQCLLLPIVRSKPFISFILARTISSTLKNLSPKNQFICWYFRSRRQTTRPSSSSRNTALQSSLGQQCPETLFPYADITPISFYGVRKHEVSAKRILKWRYKPSCVFILP